MINILAFFPNSSDATSFYRGVGPLSVLRHLDKNINLIKETGNITWATLRNADIVFLQRPWDNGYKLIAEMAKQQGIPLWIDFDDDLLNVPSWNPNYKDYSANDKQDAIKKCLVLADVITVATEKLKQQFSKYNENIVVINNAIDNYIFPFTKKEENSDNIIAWRGSKTHQLDLEVCASACINLSRKHNYYWFFLGDIPWYTHLMPHEKVMLIPPQDIIAYFDYINKLKANVFIVPLHDIPFNHCKSNIKWLEATMSGAITIAPDFPEWQKPGIINYKNHQDFEAVLNNVLEGKVNRKFQYEKSYEYINQNLLLSQINKKRIDVIYSLF